MSWLSLLVVAMISQTTTAACEDDIQGFMDVTGLPAMDNLCATAYFELSNDCSRSIPTATSYTLEDFCCAYCYDQANPNHTPEPTHTPTPSPTIGIPTSMPTPAPSKQPTTTTESPTMDPTWSTDDPAITPTDPASDPTYEPTYSPTYSSYDPTYAPTYYGGGNATDTQTNTGDSTEPYEETSFILIVTLLGILFVIGWVILYFQLENKGRWKKETAQRIEVTTNDAAESSESEDSDSEKPMMHSSTPYGPGGFVNHQPHHSTQSHLRGNHGRGQHPRFHSLQVGYSPSPYNPYAMPGLPFYNPGMGHPGMGHPGMGHPGHPMGPMNPYGHPGHPMGPGQGFGMPPQQMDGYHPGYPPYNDPRGPPQRRMNSRDPSQSHGPFNADDNAKSEQSGSDKEYDDVKDPVYRGEQVVNL